MGLYGLITEYAITETCTKCGLERPLSEFHKNSSSRGKNSQCKHCRNPYFSNWRHENPEYTKGYLASPENKKKYEARSLTRKNIHSGKIKIEPCFICGAEDVEVHHIDYENPTDIIFLCKYHHAYLHHPQIKDQRELFGGVA